MSKIFLTTILLVLFCNLKGNAAARPFGDDRDTICVYGRNMNYDIAEIRKDSWNENNKRDDGSFSQKIIYDLSDNGFNGAISIEINYLLSDDGDFAVKSIMIDAAPQGKKTDFNAEMTGDPKDEVWYDVDKKQINIPLLVKSSKKASKQVPAEAKRLVFAVPHQENTNDMVRLAAFSRNMLNYNSRYTQEKVYLHIDNTGYLPGETLWFKAYVFKAANHLPTDMSKVLYVELLNPLGQLIDRRILPVQNGRTYGDFKLDPMLCQPGYYELRAYTRAMLNWDDSYIFSRVLPIFEDPKDTINFTSLEVGETEYDYTKTRGLIRSMPAPLTDAGTVKKKGHLLTFYPEGGHITRGNASTVAFKLTDKNGLPVNEEITVCTADGKSVATARTLHDGMGSFLLPADWQGGYAMINGGGDAQFPLPEARSEGCDLHIDRTPDGGIAIRLLPTEGMRDRQLGVSVTCRGRLYLFSDIVPSKRDSILKAYDALGDGVHQVTLFTPEGEILSERLVWIKPHGKQPTMAIRQNEETYKPFSPVVLNISLSDSEGAPLRGDFSLSVRDADTETGPEAHSLQTEMLLASELKGYIHNPDYYFLKEDEVRTRDLDLLMMVQGWRRYSWKEMAGVEPFQLKQPAEDGLLFYGNITSTGEANKVLKNEDKLSLNFLMQTDKGTKIFSTSTDKQGCFALQLPEFFDDAPSVITATDSRDNRVYTDFRINRNFSPSPRAYEPFALATPVSVEKSRVNAIAKQADTFEWTDTIPDLISKVINLKTVTIKKRKPIFGYIPGLRFKWGGGEDGVKRFGTFYYNLKEELDKYQDEGNAVPNVWEWLATVNPKFEYMPATEEMFYHGRPVTVMLDYDKREQGRLSAIHDSWMMNEYRSIVVVENHEAMISISRHDPTVTATSNVSHLGATIYIFSRDDVKKAPYYKRGTRWLTLHGYSRCNEFYSPDYRQADKPTATDHRRTLYWNPSLTTDTDGKASVIFYSNARENQRLVINAQGIAVNGQMFESK